MRQDNIDRILKETEFQSLKKKNLTSSVYNNMANFTGHGAVSLGTIKALNLLKI
jgi:hypothetical protein